MNNRTSQVLRRRFIVEAGILSTRAQRRRTLAKEIESHTPVAMRKYRIVRVQATVVTAHVRKAHYRVLPNSRRRTARLEDYAICGVIRKCAILPGAVRHRLIAAILDAANRGVHISRAESRLWAAFTWIDVPVAPVVARQPLSDLWYHVARVLTYSDPWDDRMLPAVKRRR